MHLWTIYPLSPLDLYALAAFPILRRSCVADMVPVDVCINLMCVLGWKAASQPASTTPVYNCTSGGINPITWGQVEAWGLQTLVDNPYHDVFWYPGGSYKENWYLNRFFQVFRISFSLVIGGVFQVIYFSVVIPLRPCSLCGPALSPIRKKTFPGENQ